MSFREGGLRPLQQRSKPCGEREAAGENCKQEAKDTLTHTETKHTQKRRKMKIKGVVHPLTVQSETART